MYVCSLSYPACSAHAPYCHLWIKYFSTLSHKRHDFRKKVMGHKMWVLISSTTFVWNISHFRRNWGIYGQKRLVVFTLSTRNSCPILMKTEFSRQILKNYSNTKFHENPSSGSRVVPCGQTDGRTDMTKIIIAFHNFASTPKSCAFRPYNAFMYSVWSSKQAEIIYLHRLNRYSS